MFVHAESHQFSFGILGTAGVYLSYVVGRLKKFGKFSLDWRFRDFVVKYVVLMIATFLHAIAYTALQSQRRWGL